MQIESLGYVGVGATDPAAWASFGANVLGMETKRTADAVEFRMDERHHRITVVPGDTDGGAWYGWEVAGALALDVAAAELEAAGVVVTAASDAELELRRVSAMVWAIDPAGHRIEVFHGADVDSTPLRTGRELSSFVTGDLGLGHVVLMVPELEPAQRFYEDVMGFRVSDYMRSPFRATFLHTNRRHHSIALLDVGATGLHHFMVELEAIDDVGRAYDLLEPNQVPVARTLGRHTNDHMFSFYAGSPSGFEVEYGWGGRLIDDTTWEAAELTDGASFWGHVPLGA